MEIPKSKTNIWKRVKDLTKITALVFLTNTLGLTELKAQEPSNFSKEIKQSEAKAKISEAIILSKVNKDGQSGYLTETPIKSWVSPDSSLITVGYKNNERKEVLWVVVQDKDRTFSFYDGDIDGGFDRMIINNKEEETESKKMENYMYTFQKMGNLAEEAGVVSDLKPQNIKVFGNENGRITLVDFKTGESVEVSMEDSGKYILGIQEKFTNNLENLAGSK